MMTTQGRFWNVINMNPTIQTNLFETNNSHIVITALKPPNSPISLFSKLVFRLKDSMNFFQPMEKNPADFIFCK